MGSLLWDGGAEHFSRPLRVLEAGLCQELLHHQLEIAQPVVGPQRPQPLKNSVGAVNLMLALKLPAQQG